MNRIGVTYSDGFPPIFTKVLWVGRPECHATWEPAKSVPQYLVQQFEAGEASESEADTVPIYGHLSGIITTSKGSEDVQVAKKKKMERPCHEDVEGYVQTI